MKIKHSELLSSRIAGSNMEFLIIALLAILGAGLIAGGVVTLRKSSGVGFKALGAGSIASGLVMWAIIAFVVPVSVTSV